jgi:hypothetical protein
MYMPAYTFEQLSPDDFERLTWDLLQEELGVRLESFKSGRGPPKGERQSLLLWLAGDELCASGVPRD